MKIQRTANASRNILFGTLLKLYQIIVPFIMRTVMLYYLGIEYLGLSSLFTSILEVLNLAELGVGSAMVFSMYKPIAEDDRDKICALMNLYKKYYRAIGTVVAVAGIAVLPVLDKIVTGDIPDDINIYILYLLNLGATVFTYWLFAYKNSLLTAHQRNDVIHKVTIITSTIKYVAQIAAIIIWKNYYLYLVINLICQILTNIFTAFATSKMYPQYKADGKLEKREINAINQRVRDLFTAKLGGVVVGPADSIVVSAFLGITTLAIYQNYQYIMNSIISFMTIVFQSCIAGIGNSFVTEGEDKNYHDFEKFSFIIMWIVGWCTVCFYCIYQPFMEIWVGKELMLSNSIVICLCIYFYTFELNQIFIAYKDAAGIWHEDRFRPLVVSLSNLFMNIIMVQYIGLFGVLLSTIISTACIGLPWLIRNMFKTSFKRSARPMLRKLLQYMLATVLSVIVSGLMCSAFQSYGVWIRLFAAALVCITIPNLIYFFLFRRTSEFRESQQLIKRLLTRKV